MSKNVNSKKQNFVLGAFFLIISSVLCKVIGAFFKVPLQSLIGDDGMGYFNAAYTIYGLLFTISTAGIPVAVSKIVSTFIVRNNKTAVKRTFKVSFLILTVLGVLGSGVMLIFAPQLSLFIKNPDAVHAIRALSPTLFFICIEASLRGYFQGHQNMTPTSVSQVIEALGKLIIGIIGALYASKLGLDTPMIAAYAIIGIGVGAAVGALYLIIKLMAYKNFDYGIPSANETTPSFKSIAKEIALIAIPITISALVLSLTNMVDLFVIMRRLQDAGFSGELANELYGNYSTLAITYFNLPLVLMTPLSISVIPALSAAFAKGAKKTIDSIVDSMFRLESSIAFPCAFGLCVLAGPAMAVMFPKESADQAAPLLSILSISIFFVAMTSVSNAVLQSLNRQWLPIASMAAGTLVKIIVSYILIGIPEVGIYGAPISTSACYLTAMVINFFFMAKFTGCVPGLRKVFIRPFISGVCCALAAFGSYLVFNRFIGGRTATVLSVAFAAVVYLVCILAIKALKEEDIKLLPKGEKIYALLSRHKLMK